MQIQLKQSEIISAIKQYVTTQGINLSGKTVDITFSATRGAAGIIADVSIEDQAIPGFTDATADDAAKPALKVVGSDPETKASEEAATEPVGDEPAAKTTSLFN